MELNTFELIGIITGIIGSITGISSLIWHIINNRSKLIVERLYYSTSKTELIKPPHERKSKKEYFRVTMLLRNQSNRSTTIEDIWLALDNHHYPDCYKTITIPPNSSKKISFDLKVKEDELKDLLSRGNINIVTSIHHTFGTKKIKAFGTPNNTGWFHAK